MAWPVVDTFTDIAGTLLSDHTSDSGDSWTARVRNLVITSANRVMSNNSSSACECTVDVTPPSADYEVYGNIIFLTATVGRIGLWARRLADEATGYMIRFNDGNWQLLRWDDGTAVELDSVAASVVIDTDYEMKIRVEGSTITGYVDDVEVLSATDSTYTAAGLVGVYSHGNGAAPTETTRAHLSDFGARNIPSGGVVEQQPGYLAGDEPQSDQQSSYTAGREAVEDQQSGYLRVTGGEQEQQSGYLHGLEATSDQQPSYLLAGDAISEQQSAHLHGQENLADSQPAYLRSGVKLEVSTGKMLNDRFSVTTYTNEWMYLNSAEAGFVHTYADARWGDQAHGKLLNLRMVQAAFQHEGDTGYPAAFDPAQNTADFIAALPDYKAAGILAMTIGMQGGNPNYGTNGSDHDIGAFNSDGSLRAGTGTARNPQSGTWMDRLNQILLALREQGMVCILNLFYHGQDQRLTDNDAVRAAVDNVVDWLVDAENNYRDPYQHVIIDIANEYDIGGSSPLGWQRSVLSNNGTGSVNGDSDEIAGLIIRIKERYTNTHGLAWRAPVGTSQAARPNERFKNNLKLYADIALPHGNVLDDWEDEEEDTYTHMVAMRSSIDSGGNPGIPIIMNEDANQESSTNGFVNDTNRDNEVHALTDCMDADVSHGNMFNFVHQYYNSGLDTGWWHWDVGTAGVVQASRTESDYVADYLAAVTAALESDAIAASQPSYLRGEEPLSDAQANYLAAAEAFADLQTAYIAVLEALTVSKSAYLGTIEVLAENQAAFLNGIEGESDAQSLYLAMYEQVVDAQAVFLTAEESHSDQLPAYLASFQTVVAQLGFFLRTLEQVLAQQSSYLFAHEAAGDQVSAYLESALAGENAFQLAFLPALDGLSVQQTAYLVAHLTAVDTLASYLVGDETFASQQANYLLSLEELVQQQSAYLNAVTGIAGDESTQAAYISAREELTVLQTLYLRASAAAASDQDVFLAAHETLTSNMLAYTRTLVQDAAQQAVYALGHEPLEDALASFLSAAGADLLQQAAYVAMLADVALQQSAYLFGHDDAMATQAAFLTARGVAAYNIAVAGRADVEFEIFGRAGDEAT